MGSAWRTAASRRRPVSSTNCRDTFVVVREAQSGARGWGNCQPMITGAHPGLGLDPGSSFW